MNALTLLKKRKYTIFCLFFVMLEACALLIIALADWLGLSAIEADLIRYISILICLCACFFQVIFFRRDGAFLLIAMLFTAVADLFLLIILQYEIGVAVFIGAQLTYFWRIYDIKGANPVKSLIARLGIYAIFVIIAASFQILDFLTAVVGFYFINLVANAVESFFLIKIDKKYILFAVGLILFIGCDICVGLRNLNWALNLNIPYETLNTVSYLIWFFYLPSQVLIVLSANKKKK